MRIDNLADTAYESVLGYPGLPRAVVAGVRFNVGARPVIGMVDAPRDSSASVSCVTTRMRRGLYLWALGRASRFRACGTRAELASFELPLVRADRSAQHAAPDYYYRLAVRPIYQSYPIYAPGREPAGYMEWLAQQEPELAFDASALQSEAEWAAAGEAVFDAPIGYGATFKLDGGARPQPGTSATAFR